MYRLSVCTMIQGENSYLPEWIAHHDLLGVEHFFIYDNESPTSLSHTLASDVGKGLVTVVPIAGRFMQLSAFNDGLARFGPVCEWMAFIDLDEFFYPKKHADLRELLEDYRSYGGLGVNWQMFGSSGHAVRPAGLQMESFTRRAETLYCHNRHLKCIVQPRAVERMVSPHECLFRPSCKAVNENRKPLEGPLNDVSVETIQLTHYYTRSRAEFAEKLERGRVDYNRPMSFGFDDIDPFLNRVEDNSMLKFCPRVKEYLGERL